jgi:hypothetical protein
VISEKSKMTAPKPNPSSERLPDMVAILPGQTTVSRWKTRISISVELPGAQFPDGPYVFIGDDVKSGFKK